MTLQHMAEAETLSQVYSDRDFRAELLGLIPHLRAFSSHLCGWNLGEDMAQEALTKAWRARSSYRSESNMKAWLFRILKNEYISHHRRAWREVPWDQDVADKIATPPLQQQWTSELSDVRRAMLLLPAAQREALLLVATGDATYEQAAAIAAAAVGTMKSRVSRARASLVDLVGGIDAAPRRSASAGKGLVKQVMVTIPALSSN